jgi:hypothetical protein
MVYVRCDTRCSTLYEATEDTYWSSEHAKSEKTGKLHGAGMGR